MHQPLSRRQFNTALISAAALTAAPAFAQAKPLRILVGFPPGGGTDAIARMLGERLTVELGVPVMVDNKPGAGGQLAAQALKAAGQDAGAVGNTVFLSHDHSISILPLVTKNAGYEPAVDFVPVVGFATFVNVFAVSAATPAKTFAEYIAWAGSNKSAVGVPATASTPEFLIKVLAEKYKLDLVAAPYRGSAPLITDMLGNQIPAGVASLPDFIEQHKAGKLRILGVLGTARQAAIPTVPSFAELGLQGFEDIPYYGLFAAKGMPQAQIDAIGAATSKALQQPALREALTNMGLTLTAMNAAQLGSREKAYAQSWASIIKTKGFAP